MEATLMAVMAISFRWHGRRSVIFFYLPLAAAHTRSRTRMSTRGFQVLERPLSLKIGGHQVLLSLRPA